MSYEIKAVVKSVTAVQQVTEKFAKRELIVEHGDKYPQLSKFETSGERNSLLDAVSVGDTVTIQFDLRGREARNGQVYNTLSIWKLNVDSKSAQPSSQGGFGSDSIPF